MGFFLSFCDMPYYKKKLKLLKALFSRVVIVIAKPNHELIISHVSKADLAMSDLSFKCPASSQYLCEVS